MTTSRPSTPCKPRFLGAERSAFVAKLNPAGSALVYSTYLGGSSGLDGGSGIAVDSAGNAYVTGTPVRPTSRPPTPCRPLYGGSEDAFVAKLNAAGSALVYSTYLGGSGADVGTGIAVDSAGDAYVTGHTESTNFPTANPLQADYGGNRGRLRGEAERGGLGPGLLHLPRRQRRRIVGTGIAVDSSGNAYVTGFTDSTNFPTANPLQATLGGSTDAFVTKLNPAGSALVYSTYLGGSNVDEGYGIAVDASGNAYVTG